MGPYNTEMGVSKSEKERYDKESRAQGYGKGEGKRIRRFMLLSLKIRETGKRKVGKSLRLDKKQNGERWTSFTLAGAGELTFIAHRDGMWAAR